MFPDEPGATPSASRVTESSCPATRGSLTHEKQVAGAAVVLHMAQMAPLSPSQEGGVSGRRPVTQPWATFSGVPPLPTAGMGQEGMGGKKQCHRVYGDIGEYASNMWLSLWHR